MNEPLTLLSIEGVYLRTTRDTIVLIKKNCY